MINDLSNILRNLSDSSSYNKAPPVGPPIEYPTLSTEELEKIQESVFGRALGNEYAYDRLRLIEGPEIIDVEPLITEEIDGLNLWSIDGSNQTLDFSAFQILLARASIVEYNYTKENRPSYHHVETIDNSGLCLVDGNIFKDSIYLFGDSTSNLPNHGDISWIDIISDKNSPLIVSFDPNTIDKKPSSHASGWNIKFMQTLELMALERLSNDSPGVVIRDGGLYPICATVIDTKRSLLASLSFKNKIVLSSSKRISESTLFLELLTNPDNSSLLDFYFPDQHISTSLVKKLPADYILLPKILHPGQRTPFIEAVPRSRKAICDERPELTPICCYYMRKREPHTIIRIEFPAGYFSRRDELEKAIRVVAWQHEIGTKVPEIQEAADKHCQLKAEANIIRKITVGELTQKGLETLEVYE